MYNHGHKQSLFYSALAMLVALAAASLCAGFCIDRAFALDTGGLSGTGSITVHKYETSSSSTAPGSGTQDDAAQLPADAVPVPNVAYTLYALDSTRVEGSGVPAPAGPPAAENVASFLTTYAAPGVSPAAPTAAGATDTTGTAIFGGLEFGYYLLVEDSSTTTAPMLVTLPYANDGGTYVSDVHLYPKSVAARSITKTSEATTSVVGYGDTVPWKVSFPVPDGLKAPASEGVGAAYGTNWFISDVLDARLDWSGTWKLEVFDASGASASLTLVPDSDVVCTYNAATHTVTWAFTDAATRAVADSNVASLAISFETTVNAKALVDVEPIYNNAAIDFTNATGDPFHREVIEGTPDSDNPAHPRIYLGAVKVEKFLESDGRPLAGAEFALAESSADARAGRYLERATEEGRETLVVATDAQGNALFGALAPGTYYLVETKAPTFKNDSGATVQCALLRDVVEVTIEDSAAGAHQTIKVANRPESALGAVGGAMGSLFPKTGDIPWWLIALVVAGAAATLAVTWHSRTRSNEYANVRNGAGK